MSKILFHQTRIKQWNHYIFLKILFGLGWFQSGGLLKFNCVRINISPAVAFYILSIWKLSKDSTFFVCFGNQLCLNSRDFWRKTFYVIFEQPLQGGIFAKIQQVKERVHCLIISIFSTYIIRELLTFFSLSFRYWLCWFLCVHSWFMFYKFFFPNII